MKYLNHTLVLLTVSLLTACGGGGEEANTSSTPDPVVTVSEVVVIVEEAVEPDPNAVYDTTAELIASRKFLIEPEYELEVSYLNDNDRNAYLSVCSDFNEGKNGLTVNYNSCLLRISVESYYAGTLSVANDKTRLVMAIWYLDDIDNPRYEIWENNNLAQEPKRFEVN
jgi:hypothetical protein